MSSPIEKKVAILALSEPEQATVIAALRFWQRLGNRQHLPEWDIATNADKLKDSEVLDDVAIDDLCERICC